MIPLAIPNLSGNEAKYLQQCVDDNFVSSAGPFVTRFETMMTEITHSDHAVATSSGTSGLHVALLAVGVKPGDLVVLPSWTFIASANAISHCGAVPWLFDVDADSWTLCPELVETALKHETEKVGSEVVHKASGRRVSAIMPVYTFGHPANMVRLRDIANSWGLPIVSDGAAALGALYEGAPLGQMGADLTVISFNGNKTFTCGGGGCVIGNNQSLTDLAQHLTTTARVGDGYDHDMVGYNYRMTNVSAAIGCAQLEQSDTFVQAKKRIASAYASALSGIDGVTPFPTAPWAQSAHWYTGVVVDRHDVTVPDLINVLRENGIEGRKFWKPMHLQAPYQKSPVTTMRQTDKIWGKILTLPCSTHLTEEQQDHVIETLKKCFDR